MTPRQRDILLIPVPFTDLQTVKRRPVLVLSNDQYNRSSDDVLVAAITSNLRETRYAVIINSSDLEEGTLRQTSAVRIDKVYTLSKDIILKRFCQLNATKYRSAVRMIHDLID